MAYYSPNDELPIRKKTKLRKPVMPGEEIDVVKGPQIPSTAKLIGYSNTADSYRPHSVRAKQPVGSYDMSTGSRPTPNGTPSFGAKPVTPGNPTTFNGRGLINAADAITPYVSNIANALRKTPRPKPPMPVSATSVTSPSLAGERVEIDRSIRGLNNGADASLDANTANAVKTGNLVQGFRAKGQSFATEEKMRMDAKNATNQANAGIEAFNAQRGDQFDMNKLGMQIATARESSQNIANFADKRIQEIARRDAMGLDKTKFDILSKMYGSGVLDRLVKKVNGSDQVSNEDLDQILHGPKANGGALLTNDRFPRKVKLRAIPNTPPEMASDYRRNGGYIGGSIMHAPRINSKGKLRRVY